MSTLDTRNLRLFLAVAHSLNFRQAAEQLHMSQPPLSRAIQTMESRLGVRLFERDTRGVALTDAGRDLLPHAQAVLSLLAKAEASLNRHVAPVRLRLGITSSLEPGLFSRFNQALSEAVGTGTPLEVSFDTSPRLVSRLRSHRLDAALIALPTQTHDLRVEPLGLQPMMAVLRSSHPLARRRRLSLAQLAAEPVFWFERARQPAFFDHCHDVFRREGFTPRFLKEPNDHHLLLGAVAAGQGVALLPESFKALRRSGVAYRALDEGGALAVTLGLAWSDKPHPAERSVRQAARHLR